MATIVYQRENGNTEERIFVDSDGSVVHCIESAGWPMMRKGINSNETRYTADEAKMKWPNHAEKIDAALKSINL